MLFLTPQVHKKQNKEEYKMDRNMLVSECILVNPSDIFSDLNNIKQRQTHHKLKISSKQSNNKTILSSKLSLKKKQKSIKQITPKQLCINNTENKKDKTKEYSFLLGDNLSLYTTTKKKLKEVPHDQLSQRLTVLKQLWQKRPIFQQIKGAMLRMKPPLPIKYEKTILDYCSEKEQLKKPVHGTLMNAARIFKNLRHKNSHFGCVVELSQYKFLYDSSKQQQAYQQNHQISQSQQLVIKYCLMYLYFSFGMKEQFFNLYHRQMKNISNQLIEEQINNMYAKILICSSSTKIRSGQLNKQILKIQERHKNITSVNHCLKQIQSTRNINIYEAYNIALQQYKNANYKTALMIFRKMPQVYTIKQNKKILFYIKINYAKCLFACKQIQQAIGVLKKLVDNTNQQLKPYENQINSKIFCWKKLKQLEFMMKTSKNQSNDTVNSFLKKYQSVSTQHTTMSNKQEKHYIDNKINFLYNDKKIALLTAKQKQLHNLLNMGKSKLKDYHLLQKGCSANLDIVKNYTQRVSAKQCLKYPALRLGCRKREYRLNDKNKNNTCRELNKQIGGNSSNLSVGSNGLSGSTKTYQNPPVIRLNHCQPKINTKSAYDKKMGIITESDIRQLANTYYSISNSRFKNKLALKNTKQQQNEDSSSNSSSPSILSFDSNQSFFSNVCSDQKRMTDSKTFTYIPASDQQIDEPEDNIDDCVEEGSISILISKYMHLIKTTDNKAERANYYYKLGQLHLRNNSQDLALGIFKSSLQCGFACAQLKIADICYHKGNYREAIDHYEKYLAKKKDDEDRDTQIKLLHSYAKIPEFNFKAVQRVKQLLQHDPSDLRGHSLLVSLYYKQKNYDKAIDLCIAYREKYRLNIENHHMLGLLYKTTKNKQQAFNSFMAALRIKPNSLKSLIQMADLTQSANFYQELIQIYRKILTNSSGIIEIMQILKNLIQMKTLKGTQIKQILNFPQIIAHGDFYVQNQMFLEAQHCYEEASKLSNNLLIKQKLGNVAFYQEQYTKALNLFKESQLRKPIPSIQLKIAAIKLKQQEYSQAKALFNIWLDHDLPNRGPNMHLLAICEFHIGNIADALTYFKKSMGYGYDSDKNNEWINICYGKIKSTNISIKQPEIQIIEKSKQIYSKIL